MFCRVVDNLGDIGVCWRLAADLASRGVTVRLWVDDASALAWMAPGGARGVTVHGWHEAAAIGKRNFQSPVNIQRAAANTALAWLVRELWV